MYIHLKPSKSMVMGTFDNKSVKAHSSRIKHKKEVISSENYP